MGTMLSSLTGLVALVCWIVVLIHMFKDSVLRGILGLICGLYAFIWGWMNAGGGLKNVMVIWTIAIIVGMMTGFFFGFPSVLRP
jgi:hypothetical protein